jgi:hypothetical protein
MSIVVTHKTKHNQKISKAVDKTLRQVFGDEATILIYKYLKSHYSLDQDEILEKIDVFSQGLRELLKSGAQVIEMKILKDLYSDYGFNHEPQPKEIIRQDFVCQVKMLCLTKNENS